jgi:hypothetical protein
MPTQNCGGAQLELGLRLEAVMRMHGETARREVQLHEAEAAVNSLKGMCTGILPVSRQRVC